MINTILPVTKTLQPHRFIGYWGKGLSSALSQHFTHLLSQFPGVQVQSSNAEVCWGVAYLGLTELPNLPQSLDRQLIAVGSASGLVCNGIDAWVCLLDNHRLALGRDPFGRTPLYWLQSGTIIWFASHLQLLLPLCSDQSANLAALYGYSCFSYVPTPLTPISSISSVAAGTEQTWSLDTQTGQLIKRRIQQLSSWSYISQPIDQEKIAVEQLQTILKQVISRQVVDLGNEPVGVFLSGGLDSATVAALLVQSGLSVRAYTLDFGSLGISEAPYAEQVAQFLQIPLIRVPVTPRHVRQALIPTVQALDLPFGDGVTVPLFLLAQAASQDVRVVFNGEGGDQLFAGWTNKPLIAASLYNGLIAVTQDSDTDSFTQHYLQTFHRLYGYETNVFQPTMQTFLSAIPAQMWLKEALDCQEDRPFLDRLRRANLMLKGAQNIQPRATNLAAAHNLQLRSPFCDLELAQWTFQIAGSLFLQGSCEKYILKRAVENWLPPEIVWRTKRGMGVPLTHWFYNGLWSDLGIWLNPSRLRQEGVWQPDLATRIITGQLGMIRRRRIGEILWLLLVWQVWRETIAGLTSTTSAWDHPFWCPRWLALPCLSQLKKW